jgi:hypothetical protein
MMDVNHSSRLLIALSKGFAFQILFEEKVSKLLATFTPDAIEVFQDDSFIAKRFFEDKSVEIETTSLQNTRTGIKKIVNRFTHIVVFWDGDDLTEIVYFAKLFGKNLRIIPVQLAKVRNKDREERFDVYIGRGTPWGNPFPIGLGGTGDSREVVIEKYKTYFFDDVISNPEKRKALLSLRGYRLGCHCKPLACHGDIIASFLNSYEGE